MTDQQAITVYQAVGGQAFFDQLVDRFYQGVAGDPLLRPMYPEDLTAPRAHLAGFLAQYWGGPPHYSAQRGHPRLRMRHAPFAIGVNERNAWMGHMQAALDAADLPDHIHAAMVAYFDNAATHLINTTHPPRDPNNPTSRPTIPLG